MGIPDFLLRRLYQRGSLRETGQGQFAFSLQNTLRTATILEPPRIVVNGVAHAPTAILADDLDLAAISPRRPLVFAKGQRVTLRLSGFLLRGGNRIHITAETQEFGTMEIYVEDKEAEFCELPALPIGESRPAVAPGDAEPQPAQA